MEFIHSWALEKFAFKKQDLEIIKDNLYGLGFPFPKTAPDAQTLINVEFVLKMIHLAQDNGAAPWFLMASHGSQMLNTCSNIIPVSFALSTCHSVYSTSVDAIMQLFFPSYDTDIDLTQDLMEMVRRSGLLVIKSIDEKTAGASKYASRFTDLLNFRATRKLPTLFTALYDGPQLGDKIWESVRRKVENNLGASPAIIMQDHMSVIHLKATVNKPMFMSAG